jgi:hypothetical protein
MHTIKTKLKIMSIQSAVFAAVLTLAACGDNSQQKSAVPADSKLIPVSAPVAVAPTFNTLITKSPTFEAPDGWGPGYANAIGHGAGVVVGPGGDNPNVFAQQFPAKAGDQFKLVARASSVDAPKAVGRFQINWLGADSKFVSVSIHPFDVTQEEKSFEYEVTAPEGAAAGTVYVVGDGPQDVVRYTEMRVLGK